MITTGELKKSTIIVLDGELYKILDYQHVKQGRGSAVVRIMLRSLRNGANTERTFPAGSKFEDVELDRAVVQFQYVDGDTYHFMDTVSYEQVTLTAKELGTARNYLREQDTADLLTYDGKAVDVELPTSVILQVAWTEPGVRGDTATSAYKAATMDTGLAVNVPLFVNIGDKIKVDTRTGGYIERA
ncbi:MAG TPA: elongation factor P [Chloroflexia bacterium]|nr:elongation factor P [Chloroflexia bacterium]